MLQSHEINLRNAKAQGIVLGRPGLVLGLVVATSRKLGIVSQRLE
jgi:hypothetical protein